jgi:hypothetical protein
MEDKRRVLICGHCGNRTAFELVGEYVREERHYNKVENRFSMWEVPYRLFKCLTCS